MSFLATWPYNALPVDVPSGSCPEVAAWEVTRCVPFLYVHVVAGAYGPVVVAGDTSGDTLYRN